MKLNPKTPRTYDEVLKRYKEFVRLKKSGATYREIASMYGVTRQAIADRLRRGEPKHFKPGILSINGFGDLEGRDRTRMLVRIRDNFTCQDCGRRRTPAEVKRYNKGFKGLKGRIKLFDVHHVDGRCGKNSLGYDSSTDLACMVTLCHACHYGRPEHGMRKGRPASARKPRCKRCANVAALKGTNRNGIRYHEYCDRHLPSSPKAA